MTTDYYSAALQSIPDLAEIDAALDNVRTRRAALRTPAAPFGARQALAREVIDAARTGQPFPSDLARRAYDIDNAAELFTAECHLVDHAARLLDDEREATIRNGIDHALRALREPLEALLDEGRAALPVLRGISTAQHAIDAGPDAAAAWSNFGKLADRYQQLRHAQRQLVLNATGGAGGHDSWVEIDSGISGAPSVTVEELLERVGEIRNYGELNPDWLQIRREQGGPRRAFEFTDRRAHLSQLLTTRDADIWLPTLDEARRAYEATYRAAGDYERLKAEQGGRAPMRPADPSDLDVRLATARRAHAGTNS